MATHTETVGEEKGGKHGDKRLQCVVVTPEKTLFDELVDFVALPLYDGELGDPAGPHAADRPARLRRAADPEGRVAQRYFVDGGFAQVRDDVVTVLTHRAIPAAADRSGRGGEGAGTRRVAARRDRSRIRRSAAGRRPRPRA